MSLRVLMARKKRDNAKKQLEALREKDAEFEKREAELASTVEELTEESTEEERTAVQEEVDKFEQEKADHEKAKQDLEKDIEEVEKEIEEVESKNPEEPKDPVVPNDDEVQERSKGGFKPMNKRSKYFGNTIQERDAFFAREDVKSFLGQVRTAIKEKRAIDNAGLLIPEVMLPIIKQIAKEHSKLLKHVTVRNISGTGRQNIMNDMPEGIWTEMCASLNELSLGFNDVEVDGYKVGGYFAVCNPTLEDSDEDLAADIVEALGKAIGKAKDKAILYGFGTKMPLGVVTRLMQESKPSDYSNTARAWKDLHTSNVFTGANKKGVALFQDIVDKSSCTYNDYSNSELTWVMNKKTKNKLMIEAMGTNMNAAIVSGMNNTMPVVGGTIEILNFIPDNTIIFGQFDCYLFANRSGQKIEQSKECRFLDDQTVFKGTERCDGTPVIAEAFGIMTIDDTAPVKTIAFTADTANDATLENLTLGSETLSFSPDTYAYNVTATGTDAQVDAVAAQDGARITVEYDGKKVNNGSKIKFETTEKTLKINVKHGMGNTTYTVKVKKAAE